MSVMHDIIKCKSLCTEVLIADMLKLTVNMWRAHTHVFLFFNDKIWKCSDWRKIPNAYIKFQNYQNIFPLKQKSISLYIIPHEQLKNKLYIQMCFSH